MDVYGKLERMGARLQSGQETILHELGIPAVVSRIGSASCVYFADTAPTNWWEVLTSHDFEFDTKYRKGLIEKGVYHFPVTTKQGSLCFAHDDTDIDKTLEATLEVLKTI